MSGRLGIVFRPGMVGKWPDGCVHETLGMAEKDLSPKNVKACEVKVGNSVCGHLRWYFIRQSSGMKWLCL